MRSLLRLLVMWLIAVALPIHGVAAATLLHCAAAPVGVASAGHPAEHGHPPAHMAKADGATSEPAHDHAGGKSSCSACASCCSLAVLPPLPKLPATVNLAEAISPFTAMPLVVFLTSGPERPPRTTSV